MAGPILGAIFAGGGSRRFGHDKALANLGGVPLLQRVIDRVRPQVNALAISGEARDGFPLPNIPDRVKNAGPLAALLSVLAWAKEREFPLVATFSCDTPFLPLNLVDRLRDALEMASDCAVANRAAMAHPTCALWRTAARAKLEFAFASGVRSLHDGIASVNGSAVEFPPLRDGPDWDPFFNVNFRADLITAQTWLDRRPESK